MDKTLETWKERERNMKMKSSKVKRPLQVHSECPEQTPAAGKAASGEEPALQRDKKVNEMKEGRKIREHATEVKDARTDVQHTPDWSSQRRTKHVPGDS